MIACGCRDLEEMGLGEISGDHCDLDVVDGSLSSDDFLTQYISLNKPVIIRQAQMEGSPISANPGQSVPYYDSLKPWCDFNRRILISY